MIQTFKCLVRLSKMGRSYMDDRLKVFGINSGQYYYIVAICNDEGITQDKLADIVNVHPSNVARALDVLTRKGYVVKEDFKNDHRTWCLYPTEKARAIYEDLVFFEKSWIDIICTGFSEQEKDSLSALLFRANTNLGDYLQEKKRGR